MKILNRIRYYTMNSWNLSKAPAYNLKVYNVIDNKLQDKVFELMDTENFYDDINLLIADFGRENGYLWQAGFNGRSGGYLVLYKGTCEKKIIFKEEEFKKDNGYNGRVHADNYGWKSYKEAKEQGLLNKTILKTGTYAGKGIEDNEVPKEVLKKFRQLAIDIVKTAEYMAKNNKVEEEEYTITKTRKVLVEN